MKVPDNSYTQGMQTTNQSTKLVSAAAPSFDCNVTRSATTSVPAGGVRLSSADV